MESADLQSQATNSADLQADVSRMSRCSNADVQPYTVHAESSDQGTYINDLGR